MKLHFKARKIDGVTCIIPTICFIRFGRFRIAVFRFIKFSLEIHWTPNFNNA